MPRTFTGPEHYDLLIEFCQFIREKLELDSEEFTYDTDDEIVQRFLTETECG